MKIIKELFSGALGIIIIVAIVFVSALLLVFGLRIASTVYPILLNITNIGISICFFVLLPLAIFKKTRIISIYGLYIASFVFGACVWTFSFLTTYFYWGIFGVVIGLFITGIGVVPFAFIASLFHSNWSSLVNIIFGVILTFGARALALYWGEKVDNDQNLKQLGNGKSDNEGEILNPIGKLEQKRGPDVHINKQLSIYFILSYLIYLFGDFITKRIQYEAWGPIDYLWKPISELFFWALVFCVVVGIFNIFRHKKFAPSGFKGLIGEAYKILTIILTAVWVFFLLRYVIF